MKTLYRLLLLALLGPGLLSAQTYRAGFDRLENDASYLSLRSNISNDYGKFVDPVLWGYLNMYRSTKDKHYLDKFIIFTKRIQDRRDDNILGVPHTTTTELGHLGYPYTLYDANSNPIITCSDLSDVDTWAEAWAFASTHPETCKHHTIEQTAAVCLPMAQFIYYMQTDADFSALANEAVPAEVNSNTTPHDNYGSWVVTTYEQYASWLTMRVKETIAYHDDYWCNLDNCYYNVNPAVGCGIDPDDCTCDGNFKKAPNQLASMGSLLIYMSEVLASDEPSTAAAYKSKAKHLAQRVYYTIVNTNGANVSIPDANGWLAWCHGENCDGNLWEDIAHARSIMDFMDAMRTFNTPVNDGTYISETFMKRIANGFVYRIAYEPLKAKMNVYGNNTNCNQLCDATPDEYYHLASYARMSKYNPCIYEIISDYYASEALYNTSAIGVALKAFSDLASVEHVLEPYAVLRDNNNARNWTAAASGDFNNDGTEDIVVAGAPTQPVLKYYTVNSQREISLHHTWTTGAYIDLAAGELVTSNAGEELVVVQSSNGAIIVYGFNGTTWVTQASSGPTGIKCVAVADAISSLAGNEIVVVTTSNVVKIYNCVSGVITLQSTLTTPSLNINGLAVGEFDAGNAGVEYAITDPSSGSVKLYKNVSGTLTLLGTTSVPYSINNAWMNNSLSGVDIDGDGILELAAYGSYNPVNAPYSDIRYHYLQVYKWTGSAFSHEKSVALMANQGIAAICAANYAGGSADNHLVFARNFDGQIKINSFTDECSRLDLFNHTIDAAYYMPYDEFSSYVTTNEFNADFNVETILTAGNNYTIESPAEVTFRAGQRIHLTPGFSALDGSDFRAYIDPNISCTGFTQRTAAPQISAGEMPAAAISALRLSPNPNQGEFLVELSAVAEGAKNLVVLDLLGKIVFSERITVQKGANKFNLAVPGLSPGVYLLQIEGERHREKLVISR